MEDISINLPNFDDLEPVDDGTDLGTFKSVKNLKSAYDELRSCFTKNAMELAKLKKEVANDLSDKETSPDMVDKANIAPTELHIWEKDNWQKEFDDFLEQNPNATKFSDEILGRIKQDKDIESTSFPLLTAWVRVLEEKVNDDNEQALEEKISSKPELKDRIIQDYLTTVKSSKSAPKVISSREGVNNISTPKRTISSLDDAFEMAKKYFE